MVPIVAAGAAKATEGGATAARSRFTELGGMAEDFSRNAVSGFVATAAGVPGRVAVGAVAVGAVAVAVAAVDSRNAASSVAARRFEEARGSLIPLQHL